MQLTDKGLYQTVQVYGRTHILVKNTGREFESPNYLGTGLALRGVCKPGETFEDWITNRKVK